jgi:hypothetical protein
MSTSIWNVAPYPLHWPEHRDRTSDWQRKHSQFSVTFAQARSHLLSELGKMGARQVVTSSNQPVRQDGLPLAVRTRIDDPGVAVYFQRDGQAQCIPCDQWHGVLANLRAIGKTVEALRGGAVGGEGDARRGDGGVRRAADGRRVVAVTRGAAGRGVCRDRTRLSRSGEGASSGCWWEAGGLRTGAASV